MKLEFDAVTLWLIPVGIAIWFMIWVLLNWRREERRMHGRSLAGSPETNIERTCEIATWRSDANQRSSQQLFSSIASQRHQRPSDWLTR